MALVDVRALRKHRGLTQATLAKAIGLSQKRVSAMELQPGTVTVAQLGRILDVLGYAMQLQAVEGWRPGDGVGSSATSCVYVLPHRELPVIKIGKANDVMLRASFLDNVDMEQLALVRL